MVRSNQFVKIEFQFDKKKELKKQIKKIADMLLYDVTIGIHAGDGSKKVNKNINTATLSEILEQGAHFRTSKKKVVKIGEEFFTIKENTPIHIPSRIFIKLYKIPSIWNKIISYIQNKFLDFIDLKSTNKNGKKFWENIGSMVADEQKNIVRDSSKQPSNTYLTILWKTFNHPLFHYGNLLSSIKFRVNKTYKNNEKKLTKLKYITDFEKMTGLNK